MKTTHLFKWKRIILTPSLTSQFWGLRHHIRSIHWLLHCCQSRRSVRCSCQSDHLPSWHLFQDDSSRHWRLSLCTYYHLWKEENSSSMNKFQVSVTLEGTGPLSMRGRDYLLPHPELDGRYCMGIQPSGLGGFTILGNVFQNPFYTIFDRQNKRLGFAPSRNCWAGNSFGLLQFIKDLNSPCMKHDMTHSKFSAPTNPYPPQSFGQTLFFALALGGSTAFAQPLVLIHE